MKIWTNIKQFLIDARNLEAFQKIDQKNRKEMIDLIKFQFEVIAVIAIVFGLFKDFFISNLSDFPILNWPDVSSIIYLFHIGLSVFYIFFLVLFRTYMAKKELYEITINVATFIIFFEILSSLSYVFFTFFGEVKTLEITLFLILMMFIVSTTLMIIFEWKLDKEQLMSEQQNEKDSNKN